MTTNAQITIVTRAMLIAKVREYMDTPFVHHGRVKGKAIDCIGVQICAARELGVFVVDSLAYGRRPDGVMFRQKMEECCDLLPPGETPLPADLLMFTYLQRRWMQHIAMLTTLPDGRPGMIHTNGDVGRVREHSFSSPWTERLVGVYRFRGLAA